jgi:hypothetical protein
MNAGRIVIIAILVLTVVFGVGLWYANTRAYYEPIEVTGASLQRPDGTLIALDISDAQGVDADTSPLRYRACFTYAETDVSEAMIYEDATPLNTPEWFSCYDAPAIGAALEAGEATAYLGQRNILRGVDRVVALTADGRGFAWNQLNDTLE